MTPLLSEAPGEPRKRSSEGTEQKVRLRADLFRNVISDESDDLHPDARDIHRMIDAAMERASEAKP